MHSDILLTVFLATSQAGTRARFTPAGMVGGALPPAHPVRRQRLQVQSCVTFTCGLCAHATLPSGHISILLDDPVSRE